MHQSLSKIKKITFHNLIRWKTLEERLLNFMIQDQFSNVNLNLKNLNNTMHHNLKIQILNLNG